MKFFKYLIFTSLLVVFGFTAKAAIASEGSVELRSTIGESSRCYAASLLMQDFVYTIIISCRDLIYPGEFGLTNYVLWAQPNDSGNPINLGLLGYGKQTFRTNKAFGNLFVTIEGQVGGTPAGKVIMRGNVSPISFLERPSPATPTPEEATEGEDGEQTQEPEESKPTTTRDKLFLALRRAGIAALIALVALIGLIFVVTRSRG